MGELLNNLNEVTYWIFRPLQIRAVYVNILVKVVVLNGRELSMGFVDDFYTLRLRDEVTIIRGSRQCRGSLLIPI
jgi:hypothetical protein